MESRNRYRFPCSSENQPIVAKALETHHYVGGTQHTAGRMALDNQHAGAVQNFPNLLSEQGSQHVDGVKETYQFAMMSKITDGWNGFVSLMRKFLRQ